MAPRKDRLLLVLLTYVALSVYEPSWRVPIRAIVEGDTFSWGLGPIGGTGVTVDLLVPLGIVAIGSFILFRGWRGDTGRLFRTLLGGWALFLFAQSLTLWLTVPDVSYDGGTIGVLIPIGSLLLVLDSSFLLLTGLWLVRQVRQPRSVSSPPPWTATNRYLFITAIAMFLVIYLLLVHGEQDGLTDQLGVWGTFVQWLLLNGAVYPWGGSTAAPARPQASA